MKGYRLSFVALWVNAISYMYLDINTWLAIDLYVIGYSLIKYYVSNTINVVI